MRLVRVAAAKAVLWPFGAKKESDCSAVSVCFMPGEMLDAL